MRGGCAMDKINVLWMNNGDESLLSFTKGANQYNISITTCNNMKECRKRLSDYNLEDWDAIMLNAAPKREEGEKPQSENLSLAYIQIAQKSHAPIFVVTTKKLVSIWDKREARRLSGGRFYELEESSTQLYEDIIAEIENNEDYRIRQEYEKVIEFYVATEGGSTDILLVNLLKKLNKDDLFKDSLVPANVRLILDKVMTFLTNIGILRDTPFTGSNLRECSIELGKKGWVVPYHVQRCFHICVDIANNGNHQIPEESEDSYRKRKGNPLFVQEQIKNCKAPYLNKALIYNLLNILYWCASLNDKTFRL